MSAGVRPWRRRSALLSVSALAVALITAGCASGAGSSSTGTGSPSPASASASSSPTVALTSLNGKILFTRAGGKFGDETVFTASANGTNERRITGFGTQGNQCCPRWSPNGGHILMSVPAPDGKRITTGIINPDGSHERKIPLPNDTLNLGSGIGSPDGTHIAFEGWSDARSGMQGIYVAQASDGSGLVRVTRCSKLLDDRPMDYSPDGSQIYLFRTDPKFPRVTDEPLGSLFVVNVDGTNLRRVTPPDIPVETHSNAGGKLSADGRWIVFTSSGVIWKIHPDGSGLTKVFDDPQGRLAVTPTWSPDGRLILFGLDPPGTLAVTDVAPPNGLYLIRADGTGLTPLVTSDDWKREPDWSAR